MLKVICQECMAKDAPWNFHDEKLWEMGRVCCPHMRNERPWSAALILCLRQKAHCAAMDGSLVVIEEE